jgi:Reverse transcriptase (RNA-dependent DNA polymerase)
MLEEEGSLEPGGVELNVDENKWFGEVMEQAMVISEDEPSLVGVLGGDEHSAWSDAIDVELTKMEKVNTWVPIIPPQDANIIPSHYIFHCKPNKTGSIIHYKACLVIKGFKQKFGVDYIETFAPTVDAPTQTISQITAGIQGQAQCSLQVAHISLQVKTGSS